jgi:mRNA-degrading endonuclease RelE of RelBE toxin-antitoxin system
MMYQIEIKKSALKELAQISSSYNKKKSLLLMPCQKIQGLSELKNYVVKKPTGFV